MPYSYQRSTWEKEADADLYVFKATLDYTRLNLSKRETELKQK